MDWSAIIVGILAVLGSYAGNVALSSKKTREDNIKAAERETRQEDKPRNHTSPVQIKPLKTFLHPS